MRLVRPEAAKAASSGAKTVSVPELNALPNPVLATAAFRMVVFGFEFTISAIDLGPAGVSSFLQEAAEIPMLIKTTRRRWNALEARLRELHPYEVPELIALNPSAISAAYAGWVIAETRSLRR